MKYTLIGSTQYALKMRIWVKENVDINDQFRLPAFDSHDLNELEICKYNRANIEWADKVILFWDQRSFGTMFDFGICFALRKPIEIAYLESKTFVNLLRMYEGSEIL